MSWVQPNHKSPTRRFPGALALAGVALVGGLGAAASSAAAPVDPDSGPTTGGDTVTIAVPQHLSFVEVAAAASFALALSVDGTVCAWGSIYPGLGDAAMTETSSTPVTVAFPVGTVITDISAHSAFAVALSADDQVYTWGQSPPGAGISPNEAATPTAIVGIPAGTDIVQVVNSSAGSGGNYGLALTADGDVYGWGSGSYGVLGVGSDGMNLSSDTAILVPLPNLPAGVTLVQLAAGPTSVVAIGSDGAVYTWGSNSYGERGVGDASTPTVTPSPVAMVNVPVSETVVAIAAGGTVSWPVNFFVTDAGSVYSWGANERGVAGRSFESGTDGYTPGLVDLPSGVVATSVNAGGDTISATTSTGAAYAWGLNYEGQFANGSTDPSQTATPTLVNGGVPFVSVVPGGGSNAGAVIALPTAGGVLGWGSTTRSMAGPPGDPATTPVAIDFGVLSVTSVTFGGTPAAVTSEQPGSVTVAVPSHAEGQVDVVVTVACEYCGASTTVLYESAYTYVELTSTTSTEATTTTTTLPTATSTIAPNTTTLTEATTTTALGAAPILPVTGGRSRDAVVLGGLLAAGGAALILVSRRRLRGA